LWDFGEKGVRNARKPGKICEKVGVGEEFWGIFRLYGKAIRKSKVKMQKAKLRSKNQNVENTLGWDIIVGRKVDE